MIPETPRQFAPASQEGLMFDALSLLPNDYYIFHSFRITTVSNVQFNESETDFVIFNPKLGIICLEAKAGLVKYENGYWYYASDIPMHNGGPFNQASANKYKLIEYIKKSHCSGILPHCKFLHAVWFPAVSEEILKNMTFPSEADKSLVLTKEDLQNPQKKMESIFSLELPQKIKTSLSEYETKQLIREILCPQFNVFPTATFNNDLKKIVFHRMLKEQSGILNFLYEQKTASICGAAGTGKTMIAVEKAQRHANNREKTLFLCYNVKLKEALAERFNNEHIDFFTLDGFACKVCNSSSSNYEKLKSSLDDMYFKGCFPYKNIVIDEGQDFGMDNMEEISLIQLMKDIVTDEAINGTFYVFYDKNQLVQSDKLPKFIAEADCKLTLYRNCRNTENIAITSLKMVTEQKPLLVDYSVKGKPPVIHYCDSDKDSLSCLNNIIKDLENDGINDICILTCKTENDSILTNIASNGKYQKKYLFTTCRKFKGLESDAVILIDVDQTSFNKQNAMLYYVGMSRARLRLDMVAQLEDEKCADFLQNRLNFSGKYKNAKRELATALNAVGKLEKPMV